MIGAGLFGETGNQASDVFPGAVLRLSYGLDLKVSEQWSVMPGAGIRAQLGEVNHIGWVGGDPDGMAMADLFCQARLNGKDKIKKFYLGLQPSIVIQSGKHFQWGFEASVGLRNMLRQYPEYNISGQVHLHNLMVFLGWRF